MGCQKSWELQGPTDFDDLVNFKTIEIIYHSTSVHKDETKPPV